MITYDLFTKLYGEAKTYDSLELYISERGWQDWMDNFNIETVTAILRKIYEYSA